MLALDPGLLIFLVILLVVLGLGAGSYPAFVLSGFRPVEVLKNKLQVSGDKSLVRRGLVVVQFALAILMITSTLFVSRQLDFLQTKNLGFDEEQVIVLRTGVSSAEAQPVIERFRNAVDKHDAVVGLAASDFALDEGWARVGYTAEDGSFRQFNLNRVTPGFLETMGIELVAGRSFDPKLSTDSSALVINEAFAEAYGWTPAEKAIGQQIPGGRFPAHEIIGVVKDFNYESLHNAVRPLALVIDAGVVLAGVSDVNLSTSPNPKIVVRVRPNDVAGTMGLLRQTWKEVAAGLPFDYYFLDDAVDARYRQEERLSRIAGTASVLAIVIACLGLFGLATLTVIRRTKEIGIRKVLGATAAGVVLLLSRDFIKLVLVAFVLAAPVAYMAVRAWLEGFAYRVDLSPEVFLLAGALALVVALVAIAYHAFKAALLDPVKSLRYE